MPRPESGRYPYRFRARTSNTMIGLPRPRRTLLSMPLIRPSDNFLGHGPPGPWHLGLVLGPGRRPCDDTANLGARKAIFATSVRATNYCLWRRSGVFLRGGTCSSSSMATLGRFPQWRNKAVHVMTARQNLMHDTTLGGGGEGRIRATWGWISVDRGSKATLPLTMPRRVFKSSAKDSARRPWGRELRGGRTRLVGRNGLANGTCPWGRKRP